MLVELDHVQKQYGDFRLNCSVSLKEGNITGIIGANGAGKSTMFKAILGLIRTDGGVVTVLGKDSGKLTAADRTQIGTVLADSSFNSTFTIKDVAAVMEKMYPEFRREIYFQACERYQLPLQKRIKDFSTGMRAKFKLLTAMSFKAKLLILDEPTVGVDSVTRSALLDEMREFMNTEGRGILISSHISSDLEGLCDDLYFIQNGEIILHEDTDVILSDYAVLKVNEEQYRTIDKNYILYQRKEPFGYALLTKERKYYYENYREIAMEKGGIDDIMLLMAKGERR